MTQESQRRKPFHAKGMTSFIVTLGFLLLGVSGIVLYVAPRGRVAHWTGWSVMGLDKETWGALHTAGAFLFLVAGALHLYYNWTTFFSYFKMRFEKGFNLKREFALALIICGLVFAGAIWNVPPVAYLAAWNEDIKDYWETVSAQPPAAHAEEWTLRQMAENRGMDLEALLDRLKEKGCEVTDSDKTIKSIAEQHGMSPNALFVLMGAPQHGGGGMGRGDGMGRGGGMGRRTLEDFCSQHGIPVQDAVDRLSTAGIAADAGQTLRAIADAAGVTPADIADIAER
ncbi:MAG TPA: DUF4405 domain-containing protein [Candidatus Hydrogenedentes bacterium]|jgi:hypothetical protein|nr:DUF4405 domain-containing protein [Candidatus Hydrogenedentota bacterium]HPJ99145.1 DUF4405 domain-containing protein [Candidatus Hydrogenedentota bacterium]